MTKLIISDLEINQNLSRKAMQDLRGKGLLTDLFNARKPSAVYGAVIRHGHRTKNATQRLLNAIS